MIIPMKHIDSSAPSLVAISFAFHSVVIVEWKSGTTLQVESGRLLRRCHSSEAAISRPNSGYKEKKLGTHFEDQSEKHNKASR